MKKRRMLGFVLLVIVVAVLTTGCWSRGELNNLAIVTGIGIDKMGDEYLISTQMLNPGQAGEPGGVSGGSGLSVTTEYMQAPTVLEGIRRLTTVTPRRLYFAHINVLVFGESVAREGLRDVLDLFMRDQEIRPDLHLVLTKGVTAKDVMSVMTPIEQIPAAKLLKSLNISEKSWASTIGIKLDEYIIDLMNEGKEPILTGLKFQGNIRQMKKDLKSVMPPGKLKYAGIGVFKEDKLLGWLNEEESRGFSYITDHVDNTVAHIPCGRGGNAVIEILRSKTKLSGKLVDGEPVIKIEIKSEANVGEMACKADLSKPKTIYDFEKSMERVNEDMMRKVIQKAQKVYESDIFGFGEVLFRKDPKNWKAIKEHWDEYFPRAKVEIHIDVKLRRTGKIGNSFIGTLKK
ncbi:Ger(x)C family spore germination protein [Paenibacillus pasadenensis]|uniref:Ger(x)C family spore germination protein n=1 Tax=Paenibacillus pasadenensis TaxID=217090 RepID=UPI002042475B|nr:Ger(x)C family spore germination protein [Paenibacillus pasadenensis]MCM3748896.1 Ger(x)C family spore germination protein [Paenibacillus pasadenensis]